MYVALLVVAGLLLWAGATLIIDAWIRRRKHVDLVERLQPFQPSLAEETEVWLRRQ